MKEISRFCYSKKYSTVASEDSEGEKGNPGMRVGMAIAGHQQELFLRNRLLRVRVCSAGHYLKGPSTGKANHHLRLLLTWQMFPVPRR